MDFQNIGFTAEVSVPIGGVPEPATWLMMTIGFGMIGAVARNRRHQSALSLG